MRYIHYLFAAAALGMLITAGPAAAGKQDSSGKPQSSCPEGPGAFPSASTQGAESASAAGRANAASGSSAASAVYNGDDPCAGIGALPQDTEQTSKGRRK